MNPQQELQDLIDTIEDGTLVCVVMEDYGYGSSYTVIGRVRSEVLDDGEWVRSVARTPVAYLREDGIAHLSYSGVGVLRLTVVGAAS